MEGWIKLHRKLIAKAFYRKDSEAVHLWIHIIFCANRSEREEILGGKPIICLPGQFTTGRKQLSESTGICESKIERLLKKFEEIEQQIEQQKTNTNRLISVVNWGQYQISEQQDEQRPNNDRTTSEHTTRSIRIKEKYNNMSEKSAHYMILFDQFRKLYPGIKRGLKVEYEYFLKKNEPKDIELLMPALQLEMDYRSKLIKQKNPSDFIADWKNLKCWINQKCWTQELPEVIPKQNGKEVKFFTYSEMTARCNSNFTQDNFEFIPETKLWKLKQLQNQM